MWYEGKDVIAWSSERLEEGMSVSIIFHGTDLELDLFLTLDLHELLQDQCVADTLCAGAFI